MSGWRRNVKKPITVRLYAVMFENRRRLKVGETTLHKTKNEASTIIRKPVRSIYVLGG